MEFAVSCQAVIAMAGGAMSFALFVSCVYGLVQEQGASDAFRSRRVCVCMYVCVSVCIWIRVRVCMYTLGGFSDVVVIFLGWANE